MPVGGARSRSVSTSRVRCSRRPAVAPIRSAGSSPVAGGDRAVGRGTQAWSWSRSRRSCRAAIDVIAQLVGDGCRGVDRTHRRPRPRACCTPNASAQPPVTHLFNAMAPFGHRAPGPIGVTLADDSLIAGLICDGIHVDPLVVRVAWQALGPPRRCLSPTRRRCSASPPGRRRLGEIDIDVSSAGVRTPDGTLAGSDLALDQAVRNLVAFTGCTAAEAVATVTTTPARLLGLDDRGSLETGRAGRCHRARPRAPRRRHVRRR